MFQLKVSFKSKQSNVQYSMKSISVAWQVVVLAMKFASSMKNFQNFHREW